MTTIGITQGRGSTTARPARSATKARQILLAFGIVSSVLYVAADVLAGVRYPGYSFWSQTISELAAIGAPSKSLVDPLFMTYPVLMFGFAVGVLWAARGRNRALTLTGALLAIYTVVSGVGFIANPMHQRGVSTLGNDLPHIVVAMLVVLLLLLTIGVGAFALGKRFRVYSLATVVTVLVFGALTAPYVTSVAADKPTPGLGIIERVDVYAAMLWFAVLSIGLLRAPDTATA